MTTTEQHRPRKLVAADVTITRSTSTSTLRADVPASWRPIPPELRSTVPAPCTRCARMARLPFGPGEALCDPCGGAQPDAATTAPGIEAQG